MAICFDNGRKISIIDRTIPEISLINPQLKRLGVIYLCWMLKSYGVDLFEINRQVLKEINKLPAGLDFIFRIQSEDDLALIETFNIKSCIINEVFASDSLIRQIKSKGISVVLEVSASDEGKIVPSLNRVADLLKNIDILRVTELERVKSFLWVDTIRKFIQNTEIKIDICASNRLFMATSIAFEGILNNVDSVSATFSGIGAICEFAAFEEVLLALKVLKGIKNASELNTLPDLVNHFKKISGIKISQNKPIIGENIFKYESGLHADGIEKNPLTYEPFDPNVVGQQRALIVGKHSGSSSIVNKLKELGIACSKHEAEKLLKIVRDRSINLGRNLHDDEVVKLYCKLQTEELVI